MIVKTIVSIKSKGQDVTRWLQYLERKNKDDPKYCSEVYYYIDHSFSPLYMGYSPAFHGKIPTDNKLNAIAENSGVVRQVIIAPLRNITPDKMMNGAYETIEKYKYLTGKTSIIHVYAYHIDTGFKHIHILLYSPRSSELYMKLNQMELLKYIAVDIFQEPIGKIAHMRHYEEKMKKAKNEKERQLYKDLVKAVSMGHPKIYRSVSEEIDEMEM